MRGKIYPILLCLAVWYNHAAGQIITTIAGDGTMGTSSDGMEAIQAWVAAPLGAMKYGDKIYYSESRVDKVRFIDADGFISTIAGTGTAGHSGDGGLATNAELFNPGTIINDNAGNIYFIDQYFTVIRKISTSGIITTFAGGQGFDYTGDGGPIALAKFKTINDIFFDNAGNNLYIVDWWSSVVRKVNMATGIVTTVIGTGTLGFSGDGGPATNANTNGVYSVVADNTGNIYVADADNRRIRKVNPAGIITTVAGTGGTGNSGDGGPATAATFYRPIDLAIDASGNLYVYDTIGVIRRITPAGIISRYAGTGISGYSGDGGAPLAARIDGPNISIDANQVMYLSDAGNNRIRKIYCPEIIIEDQSYIDTSVCLLRGDSARFFIEAINASGYQWQINTGTGWNNVTNNATYSGATTPMLKVQGITGTMNNYQYRCRAYNNCSELFSPAFNLHVFLSVTPSVSISASANNICPGAPVTFTATPTNGGASPYYIWYRNGQAIANGAVFTTSVLANADVITCMLLASNFCATINSAISNPVTIAVNPGPSLVITASATTICSGTTVTVTANVTNPGTSASYQWKLNGVNVGTNSNTYFSNTLVNGDIITCTYSSTVACGSSMLTSNAIRMTVNVASPPAVYINIQGGCTMAYFDYLFSGIQPVFTAAVTNGGSSPVYQWKKNGVNAGSNSPSYTGGINDGDVISCVLTSNSTCASTSTATSNSITFGFGAFDIDPAVTLAASNDMCEPGTPVTLTATITGTGSIQWQKNGVNTGTNSNTYTDSSPADGDVYSCTISSNSGCSSTRTATASITFSCTACGPSGPIITTIVSNVGQPLGAVKGYGGNIYYTHDAKVSMLTPAGNNVLLAGTNTIGYSGDGGPATAARLAFPAVVITAGDGTIYFNEFTNKTIRKIDPVGIITTVANILGTGGEGSPLNLARFRSIEDIFLDKAGDLYIVDVVGNVVKKVNMTTNQTYTIAGTGAAGFSGDGGPATLAQLNSPSSVAVDSMGNIYITDEGNFRVRKISPGGIISTIAGTGASGKTGDGGLAIAATLFKPHDLAADNAGNLYIGDWGNGVRKITSDGIIRRVAGNGNMGYTGDSGPATLAQTASTNVSVDADNNIYISEFNYNVIRKVSCAVISINRQPVDTTLCNPPGNVSFSVVACNSPAYQWQLNTGTGWTDISDNGIYTGTTKNKLNIIGATLAMNNYQYRCRAYSTCNTVFSSPAVLKIKAANTPAVNIITSTGTICQGANSIFTATPQFGGIAPSYQWKKNGINVGTNSNSYIGVGLVNGDLVTCVLTASADECVTTPTATSNVITVTVNPIVTPTITITASANNICAGTPVTFSLVSANAGSAPFYQWQKNGVNVAAGITYTDNTIVSGDVIHCALISNAACTGGSGWAFSNDITMNIVTAVTPTISIAASGNNVCAGTAITFNTIITNGGVTPAYQWKKNGLNVGANNNSYTDNTLNNADIVTCVLTSSSGCATSPTATSNGLTMIINPVTPPSITITATSGTICAGVSVTFTSVINNGGPSPAYQWKKNGMNVGTNSSSYTDNTLNNADIISCVLTASGTCAIPVTATSNTITMTVNPLLAPYISITASGNTICAGTAVTFSSVITNGGTAPVYQWKKNGINAGTNNNSYTDNTLNNADIISCQLSSNAICATPAVATSNNVTMIVNPILVPSIFIAASANNICAGTTVTFSATITNGGTSPVYQWKKNGVNTGTNSNSYLDNTLNNGDIITCQLNSNAVCATPASLTSNAVTMIVNPVVTPTITITASSATICTGTAVVFSSVIANGGAAPVYQWKKNGLNTGTNSNSYTDNTLNNGDIISCVLTSNQVCTTTGTANSNTITMTVNPVLVPSITITATNNTICAATNVNFTSTIINAGAIPVYQWKLNGTPAGTNSPDYSSNVLNNNDIITCELVSAYACAAPVTVTSNPVQMTVDPVLTPAVTISTADNSICVGQSAIFNATITDGGALPAYEWEKNGLPVGTSSPSYIDNGVNNNDIITCMITASANCLTAATANSNIITMTVNTNPVVTLDQTPTLCTGAVRQLDAGAFSSYLWTTGQGSRTISVTGAGTYGVTVTDNNGCTGNGSTIITTMLPQPAGFLPLDTSFCVYASLVLQPYNNYNGYTWSTGAISKSITINQPGIYWLEVKDNNNCEGRSTVQVAIKQCLKGLYTPNAFTPNNDGKNDTFRPMLYGDINKFEFAVYNRWGNLVFRSKDPNKGWDGTFNGKECSAQVLVWTCSYQLNGEEAKAEKGTVTLIR